MADLSDSPILNGDCVALMSEMAPGRFSAVVTDPPYGLSGGFMGKVWDRMDGREDAGFGYYLSGLIDGEGHFRVGPKERRCEFSMKLRRDDRAILEKARRFLGEGRISDEAGSGNAKPLVRLVIDTKEGCETLVGFLARYPLRAKKAIDAACWAEAVAEWIEMPRGNRWHGPADRTRLRELAARVRNAREYRDPPWSGHQFQDWSRTWAEQAIRVLKPGGHLLAFGGTRTFHRLTCAIEDAGFEIRDCVMWVYGTGFPKSLDVSKAIDKAAGAGREIIGVRPSARPQANQKRDPKGFQDRSDGMLSAPATDAAKQWEGWGTALKPAWEPIVIARKPFVGTVAANVLEHGTGGLNIDGGRVVHEEECRMMAPSQANIDNPSEKHRQAGRRTAVLELKPKGRWPANLIHDGSDEVMELFPQSKSTGGVDTNGDGGELRMRRTSGRGTNAGGLGDDGSAARFFYTAKASGADRGNETKGALPLFGIPEETFRNEHPTVKPVALMRYLCRLATPPGGEILDPFAGSGTTVLAAREEGFRCVGIEQSEDYCEIAQRRLG